MSVDPARAALVRQQFRYQQAIDNSVKSTFPNANVLSIETSLSGSVAATLASTILSATKTAALVWEVEIEGVIMPEAFDGTVNQYTLTFPMHNTDTSKTYRLIGIKVDWQKNITMLRLRG